MISDSFIFDKPEKQKKKDTNKVKLLTQQIAIKKQYPIQTAQNQQDIDKLQQDYNILNEQFVKLQESLTPLNEVSTFSNKADEELIKLGNQIERLQFSIDFLSQDQHQSMDIQQNNNDKQELNMNFIELEELFSLPKKSFNISKLLNKFDNEYQYIQSLNLKELVSKIFSTLTSSLKKITLFQKDENKCDLFCNYDLMQDFAQQQQFLEKFQNNFMNFCEEILNIANYLKNKEKLYLTQLDSLGQQNQVLFDENCQLYKKLQQKDQESLINLQSYEKQKQPQTENQQIIRELNYLYSNKLDLLKQSIINEQFMSSLESTNILPLEDSQVFKSLNENFDKINSIQQLFQQKVAKLEYEQEKIKTKLTQQENANQQLKLQIDHLLNKQLPKCKLLLKIDQCYLTKTINQNKCILEESISQNNIDEKNINSLSIIKCHQQIIDKIDNILIQHN